MDYVARGEPPAWDYNHPTTLELMKIIYPGTNGKAIDLDNTMVAWWEVREDALRQARQFSAAAEVAKCRIIGAMGEHSLGYLPGGATVTQKRDPHTGAVRLTRRRHLTYL